MLDCATFDSVFSREATSDEELRVNVGSLTEGKRLSAWRDMLYDTFYPLDLSSPATEFLTAQLYGGDAGSIRVCRIRSDPMVVDRRQEHIGSKNGDYLMLPIPVDNTLVLSQHGRDAEVQPGDLSFVTTSDPYRYAQGSKGRLYTLRISVDLVRKRFPFIENLSAVRFHREHAPVALFMDYAASFCAHADELDEESGEISANILLELLAFAVTSGDDIEVTSESSVKIAHCRRAIAFIENQFDDFQLSVSKVANSINVSERYLQRLFAEREETVSGYIRHRRLLEAKRLLRDRTARPLSISTISYQVGFADPSHFSRLFRESVGVNPSGYRAGSDS